MVRTFETVRRAGEAIWILTEILPTLREDYAREINLLERSVLETEPSNFPATDSAKARACIATFIEKQRARLAAFHALDTAAHNARELGLPMVNNPMLVTTPRTEHWMEYAETLAAIFHSALPGRSKEAAFRFIEAVSPTISGENPTFEAIKTAFKKKRFVDPRFIRLEFPRYFQAKTASKKQRLVNRGKRVGLIAPGANGRTRCPSYSSTPKVVLCRGSSRFSATTTMEAT